MQILRRRDREEGSSFRGVASGVVRWVTPLVVAILTTGCATSYWIDRGRDAADIFTATVEVGMGARARVGPFHAGLNATAGDIGLRGGAIEEDGGGACNPFSGTELFCIGREHFWPRHVYLGDELRCEMKGYCTDSPRLPVFVPSLEVYDPGTSNRLSEPSFWHMISHPYLTQVEAQVSLVFGLRIGFNVGELLDFVLGWTTIDIYSDDLEARKEKELEREKKAAQ